MTKRILSFVIVLAMVMAFLPVHMVVSAEETATVHSHSDSHTCSEQCAGGTITWTPWGVTNGTAASLPNVSGHYYLEGDIALSDRIAVVAGLDITICLNGYNITVSGGSTNPYINGCLTIADCTAHYDADGNYVSGQISGSTNTNGGLFNVRSGGGKLVLEGGRITGNSGNGGGGGAISLGGGSPGGQFYMYGGEITGNRNANGGGVVANNGGLIYMYGGRIAGNTATSKGKGIYVAGANSRLTVSGDAYIDQVYFDNDSNPGLQVAGLTTGAKISVTTKTASAAIGKVIGMAGTQENWDCHWVEINGKSVSRDESGFKFGHFHGTQEYTARTGTGLPTGASADKMNYYYLAEDIVRLADAKQAELTNQVTICLNGHEIIHNNPANGIYNITTGSLVLEDGWAHTDANGVYQAGGVTYGGTSASTAASGAVFSVNGGSFTLKEGKIYGFNGKSAPVYALGGKVTVEGGLFCDNVTSGTGGAVYCNNSAVYTMSGGTFKNNQSTGGQAGAVYVRSGTVNITGGQFIGNYAKQDAASLYIHTSNGTMSGVTVKGNKSSASGSGFGVSGASNVTISNVTVTENEGSNGAVIIQGSAKVTMSDSVITKNKISIGAGVYLAGTANLTLNNVTITDNTATSKAAGLFWDTATAKLTVTGATKITGNTCKDAASNLYLNNADQMLAVTDLKDGASIGISNRTGYISTEVTSDWSGKFSCDDGENVVTLKNDRLYIGSAHSHCVDGKTDCGHEQEGWTKWTATDSLPTSAGCYFLAADVKLTARWNVSADVKLCLNGHSITQTQAGQRITSITGNVVLTDCQGGGVITGGTSTADGGAIRVEGASAKLTAYNITISGNTTTASGGGIAVLANAQAELTNVTVCDNKADNTAGGIAVRGRRKADHDRL